MSIFKKIKEMDIKKAIFVFTSAVTIVVILSFIGWIIWKYLTIDFDKATNYLNSKFFGSIINLMIMYITLFFFDSLYPGHTIATLMMITPESSIEDKRNATYLICTALMANAWVISYQ